MNELDLKENEFKEKLFYNHKYHDAILMSIIKKCMFRKKFFIHILKI